MAINFNELGSQNFHIKKNDKALALTIGQYKEVLFGEDTLDQLIEVLQEAKRLFYGEPKPLIPNPNFDMQKFIQKYPQSGTVHNCHDVRKGTIYE